MSLYKFKRNTSRTNRHLNRIRSKRPDHNSNEVQKKPSTKLIFSDNVSGSGWLKLFEILEDTLLGLLGFVERMLRTFFYLFFKPRKLWELVQLPDKESVLVRPLTFLFISLFVSLPIFITQSHHQNELIPIASSSDLELKIESFSSLDFVKFYVPTFLVLITLILIVAHILFKQDRTKSYRNYISVSSYVFALVYYFITLFYYFFEYISNNSIALLSTDLMGRILLYGTYVFLCAIWIISLRPLFYYLIVFKKKFYNSSLKIILSIFVGFLCVAILDFGSELKVEWGDNSFNARKIRRSVSFKSSQFSKVGEEYTAYVLIKSWYPEPIFIQKNSPKNRYKIILTDNNEFAYNPFTIEDWESPSSNLLRLDYNDEKWIKIKLKANPKVNADFDTFYLQLMNIEGEEMTFEFYLRTFHKIFNKKQLKK